MRFSGLVRLGPLVCGALIAPSGKIRPYAELMGGANLFSSTTSVRNRGDGDDIASDETHNDAAWTYGAGGGVLYQLFSGRPASEDPDETTLRDGYLLASVRYFSGSEAEYMTSGSVEQADDNSVKHNINSSPVGHWTVSVGFQGRF